MATRSMPRDDVPAPGGRAGAAPLNRYHLTVLAADLADLVEGAGGYVFDRARAGWDVSVRIPACRDLRPLVILGATPMPDAADVLAGVPRDGALAVSAKLLRDDPRVRGYVFGRVRAGDADLTAWGTEWPDSLGDRIAVTTHSLSVAARAFKAQALAAADLGAAASDAETLFDLCSESFRPLAVV